MEFQKGDLVHFTGLAFDPVEKTAPCLAIFMMPSTINTEVAVIASLREPRVEVTVCTFDQLRRCEDQNDTELINRLNLVDKVLLPMCHKVYRENFTH